MELVGGSSECSWRSRVNPARACRAQAALQWNETGAGRGEPSGWEEGGWGVRRGGDWSGRLPRHQPLPRVGGRGGSVGEHPTQYAAAYSAGNRCLVRRPPASGSHRARGARELLGTGSEPSAVLSHRRQYASGIATEVSTVGAWNSAAGVLRDPEAIGLGAATSSQTGAEGDEGGSVATDSRAKGMLSEPTAGAVFSLKNQLGFRASAGASGFS